VDGSIQLLEMNYFISKVGDEKYSLIMLIQGGKKGVCRWKWTWEGPQEVFPAELGVAGEGH